MTTSSVRGLIAGLVLLSWTSGCAAEQLDRSAFEPTYEQQFSTAAIPASFGTSYPEMRTCYYYGSQNQNADQPLSARFTARTYGGINNVMVDSVYLPGALTPKVEDGWLCIDAYPLDEQQALTAGQGTRTFASAVVTTQGKFAQAYGYFEIRATLPAVSGTWPAFWLLPVVKTKENGGRLAEIDVFEHYGAPRTLISKNKPVIIDRVGRPFSTLHYLGSEGKEVSKSNSREQSQASTPRLDLAVPHTFGVLWTPTLFTFYCDDAQVFQTPNPGVADPHYMVVNLDVSPNAGPINVADFSNPSTPVRFAVDWMRAWSIKP